MKKSIKKALGLALALALILAQFLIPLPVEAAATDIQDGVTLHCWNWSFKNIEANMEKIAAAGYTAIQTSPIQQAKQKTAGSQTYDWWVYYQPASFAIDNSGNSALGNKADFKSMCKAADKYGIKVIVDVVANHMGNGNSGSGISGAVISDLKNDSACWHDIKTNISNYYDRYNITQYCMDGLPDLNTANKKVQNYVLDFLKECVDAGADGFRFDAAKHIETPDDQWCKSDFWPTVINGIKAYDPDVYVYGELLYGPDDGGQLSVSAYTKYMSVTDNSWSNALRNNVIGGKNAGAFNYGYHKNVNADKLVLWAESHDTYAGEGSNKMSTADINKTWALAAARADAMGLYLARPNSWTQTLGTASAGAWNSKEVTAVNKFHTSFVGQSEYVSNQSGIAYVERGNSGVVLVNCSGTTKQVTVDAHVMKDGTYTDAISGNSFTVKSGKISGKIGSTGIAVVYKTNSCAHESHDKNGICASCGLDVGHNYNSGGKCTCGAVKPQENVIYFTNSDNWSTVNIYAWTEDGSVTEYAGSWPGSAMTKVEGSLYSYSLPLGTENVIFNNGSDQTADLTIPSGKNHYTFSSGAWSTYVDKTEPDPTPDPEPEPEPKPDPEPEICVHITHDVNGLCPDCGQTVEHSFENGSCSVCGTNDPNAPTIPEKPEDPTDPESPTQPESKPDTEAAPSVPDTETEDKDDPEAEKSNSSVVWIILGSVLGLAAIAVVTVILLKKQK